MAEWKSIGAKKAHDSVLVLSSPLVQTRSVDSKFLAVPLATEIGVPIGEMENGEYTINGYGSAFGDSRSAIK